eukprot:3558271-Amphidinium_carterae.1
MGNGALALHLGGSARSKPACAAAHIASGGEHGSIQGGIAHCYKHRVLQVAPFWDAAEASLAQAK